MLNCCILTGNLGADPEIFYSSISPGRQVWSIQGCIGPDMSVRKNFHAAVNVK